MQQRYPGAEFKPLGKQTEPVIVPRILIIHTMVGFLRGTDQLFRKKGYTGTESTFGIGGPWDGDALDGAVWQWQDLGRQADAQTAGNSYATSIETSDGGHPERPWSKAQVDSLILLGSWWCQQTGAPPRLVQKTTEKGFGYHRQFKAWNPAGKTCPGDVRLAQWVDDVIPAIARRLKATTYTLTRILMIGMDGPEVRKVQSLVGVAADGIYGPKTEAAVKRWQHSKGLVADGIFGPKSAQAAGWRFEK